LATIRQACIDVGWYESWKDDFSVIEGGKDESFAPVGLLDAVACLGVLKHPETQRENLLHPRYGKEPGPVIKLREQLVCGEEIRNG